MYQGGSVSHYSARHTSLTYFVPIFNNYEFLKLPRDEPGGVAKDTHLPWLSMRDTPALPRRVHVRLYYSANAEVTRDGAARCATREDARAPCGSSGGPGGLVPRDPASRGYAAPPRPAPPAGGAGSISGGRPVPGRGRDSPRQPATHGGDARHARHARRVRTEYRRVTRAVCVCSLLADDEDNGEDFAPCASSSSSPAFCISRRPQPISVIRVRQPIRRRCALPGSASSEPGPGYRPGNSRFGRLGLVGTPLPVDGRGPRTASAAGPLGSGLPMHVHCRGGTRRHAGETARPT